MYIVQEYVRADVWNLIQNLINFGIDDWWWMMMITGRVRQQSFCFFQENRERSRAREWNIAIYTLPGFAMNLSWKWRNYLSLHRAPSKYEISFVVPHLTLYYAAAHKRVTNISSNLECHLIFEIYFHVEKASNVDKNERRISFDIIQL